ncbi:DoxX family protein [Mesorhizobium sp. M1E.F.Ca.ET.041.01.1.1]|uniref:DoxX family protein n=1 Tax=Mesorhizobium sp. M1E.F.Ca.ET.041.01.1.1 TaxID=2496759 RepID=UPI000FC9A17E|nr:DoxX family protein [Mesorhizobium sp. M1E.F.Ca.ET.041.01.1.1]RUW25063.1 DoxX family protein [Mesorhizobium sp. M1E.F.Ca.ET.041.01.1.1]
MNIKWVYWIATGLLALMYVAGGVFYLSSISVVQGMFANFGYPAYIVPVLGVVKLAAAATILSRISVALSDLAYAGMFFHLILAAGAHIGIADWAGLPPSLIGLVLLAVSFLTQNRARRKQSPHGSLDALRGASA